MFCRFLYNINCLIFGRIRDHVPADGSNVTITVMSKASDKTVFCRVRQAVAAIFMRLLTITGGRLFL